QKTFYVEISRADDRSRLRERLEAATGERIAALEAVGTEKTMGREVEWDAVRTARRDGEHLASRERERTSESKTIDRDLSL
ncbi:MAG: hypothetical protein OXN89_00895, partial [Bryobacterales bacterium]|nr:hypothetical protein [Bryobacterales bacterium]